MPPLNDNDIVAYYDRLAREYDRDRFGGSYGQYLDEQERAILTRWLAPYRGGRIVDIGCGTGRFLDLATDGVDPSGEMVSVARAKHPETPVHQRDGADLPYERASVDAAFSMHVFMHLPIAHIKEMLEECARAIRPGGALIFDIPSARRRALTGHRQQGWHGGTALDRADVVRLAGDAWRIDAARGVLLFPIQRLGESLRSIVRPIDDLAGATPLKSLASYSLYRLHRR